MANVKELLPIGSVVHVKGANKNMMVIGITPVNNNTVYDYMAVLYPEGFIDDKHLYLFYQSDIDKVLYLGYVDAEMQLLKEKISKEEKKDK